MSNEQAGPKSKKRKIVQKVGIDGISRQFNLLSNCDDDNNEAALVSWEIPENTVEHILPAFGYTDDEYLDLLTEPNFVMQTIKKIDDLFHVVFYLRNEQIKIK